MQKTYRNSVTASSGKKILWVPHIVFMGLHRSSAVSKLSDSRTLAHLRTRTNPLSWQRLFLIFITATVIAWSAFAVLVNVVEGDNVGGVKGFDDGFSVQPAMLALEKQIRGSLSRVAGQNGFPSWYYWLAGPYPVWVGHPRRIPQFFSWRLRISESVSDEIWSRPSEITE